jgi:hypothetical protein
MDASSWAPVEERICVLAQNRNSISANKKAWRNFALGVCTWGSVSLLHLAPTLVMVQKDKTKV